MARQATGVPITVLRDFGIHLLKRIGCMCLLWIAVYFLSQYLSEGIGSLFAMTLGSIAGLIIGWTMAEDAVEKSSFTGVPLWTILVLASWAPIAITEWLMKLFTHWDLTFGRWMLITAAMLLGLASSVWRASADD